MTVTRSFHDRWPMEKIRALWRDATTLKEQARATREEAQRLRARSAELREEHVQIYADCTFFIQSVIDGHFATAFWRDHARATSNLRARANIVVALDDVFSEPGLPGAVHAGFDDPLAAVLTFIRASDQVNRLLWLGGSLDLRPTASSAVTQ